ncbi:helix-turn-helix domain-containing protein [Campylobacter jejuni]|uniref:helix-turn-helix domain-containing protein n=1 Tax=Campylobacter jejuni TaxID=197 RepID=UPI0032D929F0
MSVTTISQEKQVLNILLNKGKIDNFYCIDKRITTRLGAYIYNLRNKGYEIETVRNKETRNTFYILKSAPKIKKAG